MELKYYKRILDGVKTAVIVADQNLKADYSNRAIDGLFHRQKSR